VRVAAKCGAISFDVTSSSAVVQPLTRRLTFTTAALPFPRPPRSPPSPLPEGDNEPTPLPVEEPTASVAFSLDGQQFSGERVAAADGPSDARFRYRAPPTTVSSEDGS
jgi:hypothetical protein